MYSLRYLIKRVKLMVLFATLSATAGLVQEPKFFRLLSVAGRVHAISTAMLFLAFVIVLLGSFAVIRTLLETRYVHECQVIAASLLFLAVFLAASTTGFAVRVLFLPESTSTAQTWGQYEILVAAIVFTFSASGLAAIYNALYPQKVDYTKLRTEIRNLLSVIHGMRTTFESRGYLNAMDAAALQTACRAARDTASDLVKVEIPSYAAFVQQTYAAPLAALAEAAEASAVVASPESFLRACGLHPHHTSSSDALKQAFRLLQNGV
jgi:hypothetical protein